VRFESRSGPSGPQYRSKFRRTAVRGQSRPADDGFERIAWREQVDSELRTIRTTLNHLEATLTEDRAAVQMATGQWAAVRAANALWPEQMRQLRAHIDRLDEQIHVDQERTRDELDGLHDDIGRLGAYTLQTQVQERMINRVEQEQGRLAEALEAVSRNLSSERTRGNVIIGAGAAVALASTAALLLVNAPHF
jgi:hypothetical protein